MSDDGSTFFSAEHSGGDQRCSRGLEAGKLQTAEFRLAKEPAIKGTQGRFAVGQSICRLLPIRFSAHASYF
ncbi:hypothetical protein VI817_000116 [Penicillium citrinum]|nr:hypothetical protein VI817_000116 [Penicillium citrinum]